GSQNAPQPRGPVVRCRSRVRANFPRVLVIAIEPKEARRLHDVLGADLSGGLTVPPVSLNASQQIRCASAIAKPCSVRGRCLPFRIPTGATRVGGPRSGEALGL